MLIDEWHHISDVKNYHEIIIWNLLETLSN